MACQPVVITLDSDSSDEETTSRTNGRITTSLCASSSARKTEVNNNADNAKGRDNRNGFLPLPNMGGPYIIEDLVYRDERLKSSLPKYPVRLVNTYNDKGLHPGFAFFEVNQYMDRIDPAKTFMDFCACEDGECNSSRKCLCVRKSSVKVVDGKVDVEQTHFRTSDKTVYIECSPNCACRGKCKRKTFIQDAIQYRVELIMTKNRGFTCHVREPIPVGSYVCEFTGRVYKNSEDKEHNPLDSYSYTVSDMSGDENVTIVIDPFHHGNVSRFFNHSCEENLKPFRFFKKDRNGDLPHLGFFAVRDIEADEELTIDYGLNWWVGAISKKQLEHCYCGSRLCILPDPSNKVAVHINEITRSIQENKDAAEKGREEVIVLEQYLKNANKKIASLKTQRNRAFKRKRRSTSSSPASE